jgi:hypothetical protein
VHLDINSARRYAGSVRTTLRIDEDVLRVARSLARSEGKTIGEVVSELARKGLRPAVPTRLGRSGLPTFDVPADTPPLTPEMVREALEDAD